MELNNEEIRILIIEKLAGCIEPADELILEQLINDDPHVREMWMKMSVELQQAQAHGFNVNADEQGPWNRLEPLLRNSSSSTLRTLRRALLAAASILIIITSGYWWLYGRKSSANASPASSLATLKLKLPTLELPNHQVIEFNGKEDKVIQFGGASLAISGRTLKYTTAPDNRERWTLLIPPGYDYKIQLSDGSDVWLNAATSLSFPANFSGDTRELSVDGEAFFKVAANKERPFVVHTSATDVVVTGTAFNVNTYNADNIQTSLVEGSVTLRHENAKEIYLKPGFEAQFTDKLGFETRPFDSSEVLSWLKGIYYFRNIPLKDLSAVIRRWYNVECEFVNPTILNKTFSGELRKEQPLQSFLENLSVSGNVNGVLRGGKVYFK